MSYRVIQWATGAMGKTCLRGVIDHPALELVGLKVYNPKKVGADAGDIARRDPTGVKAVMDIEDILKLDADVVIHAPRITPPAGSHDGDIQRLLASGKNVISINGHTWPQHWGGDHFKAFEDACKEGGTSLLGAGLNPGWAMEKMAAAATGLCTQLDHVKVSETVLCNSIPSPEYIFDVLGFGSTPGQVDPNDPDWPPAQMLNVMFTEVVAQMVHRLGRPLDRVQTAHEMFAAETDVPTAAGTIPAGTVSHTGWRWLGVSEGKTLVTLAIDWMMNDTHLQNPDESLWKVEISGVPDIRIRLDMTKPDHIQARTHAEQFGVAGSVLNSIPLVCAAPPGVVEAPGITLHHKHFK